MKATSINEKGSGAVNEDVLIVSGNVVGVFDGATSLGKGRFKEGKTGGLLAASIAATTFFLDDATLPSLAARANAAILAEMRSHAGDSEDRGFYWSTSAAVLRVRDDHVEWFQIGDCRIVALYRDGSHRELVETTDHDLETLLQWKRMAPTFSGSIFQACEERILEVRRQTNITYGSLNGDPHAMEMCDLGRVERSDIERVLLFTDGLTIPREDPREKGSVDELVALYHKAGLAGVRDHIRELEATDPECRKYPRFKMHDDIAAIDLEL